MTKQLPLNGKEPQQNKNIACRVFKEQIDLINQLPEDERMKVLYLAINNSFNQLENQDDNQLDNQNDNHFYLYLLSVSDSLSELSKSILKLLSKNLTAREFNPNHGGYRKGSGAKAKEPIVYKKDIIDYSQIKDWWNELASKHNLTKIQVLTTTRSSKLKNRIKECDNIEAFKNIIETALDGSEFLKGDNGNNWKADFDFFLQEKSFTKTVEGAYNKTKPLTTFEKNMQAIEEMKSRGEI